MTSALATNPRPSLELAEVFRASSEAYLQTHSVTSQQRRVLRAILGCRTAAMGSHTEPCANCGQPRIAYNSCRNRHCPKCQPHKQLLWTAQREAELLPIEYFQVVFTLPHQFNAWARRYPRTIYDLLFAAATQSLLAMGQRTLGGELGITAVLHTWGQTLQPHIHLHCIVTGGALSTDGQRFQRARPGFLVSVEALSASYQAHYLRGLQRSRRRHRGEGLGAGVAGTRAERFHDSLGGLCQASDVWPTTGDLVLRALHATCGYREQSVAQSRRRARAVSLERLSCEGPGQSDGVELRRIHAAVSTTRLADGICAHPALWVAGEPWKSVAMGPLSCLAPSQCGAVCERAAELSRRDRQSPVRGLSGSEATRADRDFFSVAPVNCDWRWRR